VKDELGAARGDNLLLLGSGKVSKNRLCDCSGRLNRQSVHEHGGCGRHFEGDGGLEPGRGTVWADSELYERNQRKGGIRSMSANSRISSTGSKSKCKERSLEYQSLEKSSR
jgi:hypothetical protein